MILTLGEQQSVCGGAFGGVGRFGQGQGQQGQGQQGQGQGQGRGQKQRQEQGQGLGLGGFCVCPECGEKVSHQRGVPCFSVNCTACDVPMLREAK